MQVCQLSAQKQSADIAVDDERRIAERQIQFYLRKLDELRSYLSTGAAAGPGTSYSTNVSIDILQFR